MPEVPQRDVDPRVAQRLRDPEPTPPARPLSSTVTTRRCRGEPDQRGVGDRLHPARVHDGRRRCPAPRGARRPRGTGRPSRRRTTSSTSVAAGAAQHVHAADARPTAGDVGGRRRPWGSARRSGRRRPRPPRAAARAAVAPSRGAAIRRPGHDLQDRQVPHAVVARRRPSPVTPARSSTKVTPAPVQRDVHEHLVEGAVEERRVDGDDRVQARRWPARPRRSRRAARRCRRRRPGRGRLGERSRPTGWSIAAVIATTSGRSFADAPASRRAKTEVQVGRPRPAAARSRGR